MVEESKMRHYYRISNSHVRTLSRVNLSLFTFSVLITLLVIGLGVWAILLSIKVRTCNIRSVNSASLGQQIQGA